MTEKKFIENDRMRYKSNKLSANLTYLAIAFNVLYFILVYRINNPFFYRKLIGASVLYNLVFLLVAFLCSEGTKNYRTGYSVALIVLAALQIVRLFILPAQAYEEYDNSIGDYVITEGQYLRMRIYLVASALSALAAGAVGIMRSLKLKKHMDIIAKEGALSLIDLKSDEVSE